MATLLHGDCLDVMKTLPDKSVDLFLCDLPYGCLPGGEKATACLWDIKIDLDSFWAQVARLAKDDHTPVLMFCTTKFGYELIKSKESWFRYDLIWNKMRGVSFLQANKMPMRSHEMIYVFAKKGAHYYRKDVEGDFKPYSFKGTPPTTQYSQTTDRTATANDGRTRCVKSVVDISNHTLRKSAHPTQKPEDLYAFLIERYSKEGDTILDPTAGSFTSVFTAHKMGRKAIGIEKDTAFYEKAKDKMDCRHPPTHLQTDPL